MSTFGIAVLSEGKGWNFTIWLWVMIGAVAAVLCLGAMGGFRKKFLETPKA